MSERAAGQTPGAGSSELRILKFAVDWGAAPDVPAGAAAFTYHRTMTPMLWALIVAGLLELSLTHLVLALVLRLPMLAWTVFGITAFGLVWLIGLVNSLGKLPILVTAHGVRIRAGLLIDQWLPLDQIAEVRTALDCGDLKRPGFLKASLLAYPNTLITLASPVIVSLPFKAPRDVSVIGLHPDDADGFVAAIAASKRAGG